MELSAPSLLFVFPQVTTEPSLLRAAKADSVEEISTTPDVRLLFTSSLKSNSLHQLTTDPSV